MIKVTLSVKDLERAGACHEGIEAFKAIMGRKRVNCEWTPLHAAWAAVTLPDFVGWAIDKQLIPGANLIGADLISANLRGANLRGAHRRSTDHPIPGWKLINGRL